MLTHTVSVWLKTLLTSFNSQVFISSMRFSVYTEPLDTWVLQITNVTTSDGGKYECHLNSDNIPIKMSISLTVRGKKTALIKISWEKWDDFWFKRGSKPIFFIFIWDKEQRCYLFVVKWLIATVTWPSI